MFCHICNQQLPLVNQQEDPIFPLCDECLDKMVSDMDEENAPSVVEFQRERAKNLSV